MDRASMTADATAASSDFDLRDLIDGAALLASTANAVVQLARPAIGYGVLESKVESCQAMRHPFRRLRNTITYMSVAVMGTEEERAYYRRQVNRAHAPVRSAPDSPVSYSAFDPRLQLWVAACLFRGGMDVRTRLHGPVDEATADAIYRECRRFGTTLQVPEHMWPADRAAFEEYWAAALAELRIDPPVRDYLDRLIMLEYLPRPFGAALGPLNRFVTTGFLPPPFPRADAAALDRTRPAPVRLPHPDSRVGQPPPARTGLAVPVQRQPARTAAADDPQPPDAARTDLGTRRRSVQAGQHEHRNLSRGLGLDFAELRILRDQLRPQLGAGVSWSSCASTVNVWVSTSTLILGAASRL
jgi:uncharacterized protein (DUF2236 family)